ncbi:MAG: Fimbrial assembly family protein [Nocardioides sp.]|nr:Fimbrial assembly family protein [Nocardioides sp.]
MRRRRRHRDDDRATPTPAPEAAPAPAGVNLLSPWVLEQLRVRALRKRFGYAFAALVLLIGCAWTVQQLTLRGAEADLAGEVAIGEGRQSRIADFAPVQTYVAQVGARSLLVEGTMRTELSYSVVLGALDLVRPPGAAYDTVSLSLPVPTEQAPAADVAGPSRGLATSCPGPDPFQTRVVVACVEISGTAPTREAVSDLVRRLGEDPRFVEPFVDTTTTTGAEEVVTFTGSVGLSPRVFTRRFDGLGDATPARAGSTSQEETP